MSSSFAFAPSGRAKCRGCGRAISKGDLRFGERMPNPFGDGEMVLWFHPVCAAYKRPEPFLEALPALEETTPLDEREQLIAAARVGIERHRLPRLNGAERAPSGRARCRSCQTTIDKGSWRFSLVYYQEGRFEPAGFIHAACGEAYFETRDVLERATHFSELDATGRAELEHALNSTQDT